MFSCQTLMLHILHNERIILGYSYKLLFPPTALDIMQSILSHLTVSNYAKALFIDCLLYFHGSLNLLDLLQTEK